MSLQNVKVSQVVTKHTHSENNYVFTKRSSYDIRGRNAQKNCNPIRKFGFQIIGVTVFSDQGPCYFYKST